MSNALPWDGLLLGARLLTLAEPEQNEPIENAALAWKHGRVTFAGPAAELPGAPETLATEVRMAEGRLVTPGLIDCHTHLVFGGNRADEFSQRLHGANYEDIARAGGGILSTVRATRKASESELLESGLTRTRALLGDGVTSLEIKSGYGLDLATERKMLKVARSIGRELGVCVRTTFLGAHAVPPEFAGRGDAYIDEVLEWMPTLHDEGLIDAVDAFCESIAFNPAQTERVFAAASKLGLPVKLHAEQLSDQNGAALVAKYQGLSADHLEHASEFSVRAMAEAGSVAVLLPGACYALRETQLPPIDLLREQGVPMAVATDLNPGTSPLLSLRLAMNMACTLFRLTPTEALRGATVHAARALGLADRGTLATGMQADFVVWNARDQAELCYWIGGGLTRSVRCGGTIHVADQIERA